MCEKKIRVVFEKSRFLSGVFSRTLKDYSRAGNNIRLFADCKL